MFETTNQRLYINKELNYGTFWKRGVTPSWTSSDRSWASEVEKRPRQDGAHDSSGARRARRARRALGIC